jgi:hypothetical protein
MRPAGGAIAFVTNHLEETAVKKKCPTSKYFARATRFAMRRLDAAFPVKLCNQSDAVSPCDLEKTAVKPTPVMLSEALQRNPKDEARLSNISDFPHTCIAGMITRDSSRRSE